MTATETRPSGTASTGRYVGSSVPRREDGPIIAGRSRFTDDLSRPGMLWIAVVRSPHANARILDVDLADALATPGVIAAFSGAELQPEWQASLPCIFPVGDDLRSPAHWPLTADKARHVGDGVAVVIAESRAAARDGADLVVVDYEPLPAAVDPLRALSVDAPLVHEDFGTNECYTWRIAEGDPDAVFATAPIRIAERYRQNRLIISAMEPRSVLVEPAGRDEFTVWSSTQIPHLLRTFLAAVTGIPETKLRVIAPDVGGAFGGKCQVYPEEALCLALARRLGRAVKWTADRSDDHLTTHHSRDVVQDVEIAATEDGRLLAIRAQLTSDVGAYLGLNGPGIPMLGGRLYSGCYDLLAYDVRCRGVFTHTTMVDAYRGAGRPEAAYAIERAVDALARRLGKDPIEIRRRNFIREFPATTVAGLSIDVGDFGACVDRMLEILKLDEVRAEQRRRRETGAVRQIGVGFSTYIELAGFAPSRIVRDGNYGTGGWEAATVRCLPSGAVQVLTGSSPHGQGHETVFSQIVADELGIDPSSIEVVHGDTAALGIGIGTFASRSVVVGGTAVYNATHRMLDKARVIAAHTLEVDERDLEYGDGRFRVKGTQQDVTLVQVAEIAWLGHDLPPGIEAGLEGGTLHDPPEYTWPSGAHAVVLEIDTETGAVDLLRVVAVDDVGVVINPMLVEGQAHGGLAQGLAQALWEEAVYDTNGNLLTGSFMNYELPSATELPRFETDRTVTPSTVNPLGTKGAGETGTIGVPAAVVNAALDALAHLGVEHLDMPLTPERILTALDRLEQP